MSWRRFFQQSVLDRDRAEELRSYLEIETEENIARGMSPDAARRAAHLKLGNTVRIREEILSPEHDQPARHVRARSAPGAARHAPAPRLHAGGRSHARAGHRRQHRDLRRRRWRADQTAAYPNAGELVSIKHVAPGLNVSELRMSPTQYFTYRDEGRVFQHIGLYGDGGRPSPESASRSRRARWS
jgi:hypothetical protein